MPEIRMGSGVRRTRLSLNVQVSHRANGAQNHLRSTMTPVTTQRSSSFPSNVNSFTCLNPHRRHVSDYATGYAVINREAPIEIAHLALILLR